MKRLLGEVKIKSPTIPKINPKQTPEQLQKELDKQAPLSQDPSNTTTERDINAMQLLLDVEKRVPTLHHDGGKDSGVSLGIGYDMKGRTGPEIVTDLTSIGAPKDKAEIAAQAATLKGEAAAEFARQHKKDLTLTPEQQDALLRKVYPQYKKAVENGLGKEVADKLTDDQFAAALSYAYNKGATGFKDSEATQLIKNGDFNEAQRKILGDVRPGQPAGLYERRRREADKLGPWMLPPYSNKVF